MFLSGRAEGASLQEALVAFERTILAYVSVASDVAVYRCPVFPSPSSTEPVHLDLWC